MFEKFATFLLSQMKNYHKLTKNVGICQFNWQCMVMCLLVFSVKRKLCSGHEKAEGLSVLIILIFARFEFDSAIYCNFCSFWVSFIYSYWFVVVLRLEDYLNLLLLILGLMELFNFLWKTCTVEKVFFD